MKLVTTSLVASLVILFQVPLPKPTGGKFNLSKPKTDLEWIETRSRQLPGPGQCGRRLSSRHFTATNVFCRYDMTGMQKMSGGEQSIYFPAIATFAASFLTRVIQASST
jgi:hypothetical protein